MWPAAAKASAAKIYVPKAERPLACQFVQGAGTEEYGEGEKQGGGEHEKEVEGEHEKEVEGEEKEGKGEGEKQGEEEYEKEDQAEKQEVFEKEGAKAGDFEEEEGERKGKYVEEKREEEEWTGEKDGFPVFPLPSIRRVAEVPVLTGFPVPVAPSVALKIVKSEKEGTAEVQVLPEITLDSTTPTLPTLFTPITTNEGEAEK